MFADTFILQNCEVTSPSVGTIRVSCDSSHQIEVNAVCVQGRSNLKVTSNGYSPITVMGLDLGKEYTVSIHVFDGNQVVSNNKIIRYIRVISTTSSKIVCSIQLVMCCYMYSLNYKTKVNQLSNYGVQYVCQFLIFLIRAHTVQLDLNLKNTHV